MSERSPWTVVAIDMGATSCRIRVFRETGVASRTFEHVKLIVAEELGGYSNAATLRQMAEAKGVELTSQEALKELETNPKPVFASCVTLEEFEATINSKFTRVLSTLGEEAQDSTSLRIEVTGGGRRLTGLTSCLQERFPIAVRTNGVSFVSPEFLMHIQLLNMSSGSQQ